MDNVEARVRCLELAAQVCRAQSEYSAEYIAEIASRFYSFVETPQQAETPVVADKQKRGRPSKVADLLE